MSRSISSGAARRIDSAGMARKRKNPHAVALAKRGVAKGNPVKAAKARWQNVPKEKRADLARQAALARWERQKPKG
jgi:hypothetical protein